MRNVIGTMRKAINLRNLSIRSQLMFSLLVIIIPFIIMSIFAYKYYLGFITQKLIESRVVILNEMSRNVGQLLGSMEAIAQQI